MTESKFTRAIITDYSEEEVAQLEKLLAQVSTNHKTIPKEHIHKLRNSQQTKVLVLKDEETIVAMATLNRITALAGDRLKLEEVVVDEAYRGQRLGTALMRFVIDEAKSSDCIDLKFTSTPDRVPANKLYQSFGFEQKITNSYRLKLR